MRNNEKSCIETARTDYVCCIIVENSGSTGIIGYKVSEEEDYEISDAWLISTANTEYPLENKTVTGGFPFKENGEWRGYFTGADKSNSMFSKFSTDCTIATGTPVYILNAETEYGEYEGSKWDKMKKNPKSCLSILAADGVIVFSHKTLMDAFLGFTDMWVRHKTEFGDKGEYRWEKKAVYDLTKGFFIPCRTPAKLVQKKNR